MNAPLYRTSDPYAEVVSAVSADRARDTFVDATVASLHHSLRRPFTAHITPHWAYAIGADTVPVGRDFAAWLSEQGDDAIAQAVFSGPDRARLIAQYVQARARVDADARDWFAEADEARAWERGGMA